MKQAINVSPKETTFRLRIRGLHVIVTHNTVKSEQYPPPPPQSCRASKIHQGAVGDEAVYADPILDLYRL
jgi:hypothetical protein